MTLPDSSPEAASATFADLRIHPAVLRAIGDVVYETPMAIQAATVVRLPAGAPPAQGDRKGDAAVNAAKNILAAGKPRGITAPTHHMNRLESPSRREDAKGQRDSALNAQNHGEGAFDLAHRVGRQRSQSFQQAGASDGTYAAADGDARGVHTFVR